MLGQRAISPRGERVLQRWLASLLAQLVLFGARLPDLLVVGECLKTPACIRGRIERFEEAFGLSAVGFEPCHGSENFVALLRRQFRELLLRKSASAEVSLHP